MPHFAKTAAIGIAAAGVSLGTASKASSPDTAAAKPTTETNSALTETPSWFAVEKFLLHQAVEEGRIRGPTLPDVLTPAAAAALLRDAFASDNHLLFMAVIHCDKVATRNRWPLVIAEYERLTGRNLDADVQAELAEKSKAPVSSEELFLSRVPAIGNTPAPVGISTPIDPLKASRQWVPSPRQPLVAAPTESDPSPSQAANHINQSPWNHRQDARVVEAPSSLFETRRKAKPERASPDERSGHLFELPEK